MARAGIYFAGRRKGRRGSGSGWCRQTVSKPVCGLGTAVRFGWSVGARPYGALVVRKAGSFGSGVAPPSDFVIFGTGLHMSEVRLLESSYSTLTVNYTTTHL